MSTQYPEGRSPIVTFSIETQDDKDQRELSQFFFEKAEPPGQFQRRIYQQGLKALRQEMVERIQFREIGNATQAK